jgi:hypothetical protein
MASIREQRLFQSFRFWSIAGVAFGLIVRLVQYLSNRSLWEDEANLALNLVNRSYTELLQPLDYNQAAPPGFLWIEKAAIQFFGNTEYALRLFPLIAGSVSLIAFYQLATRYAVGVAVPIAIALFACLKYPLYYASEVKQYSSDVMVALLLALWLIPLRNQKLDRLQLLRLGLLGAGLIWLSHPAVFVLAGIETSYFLIAANKQRWAMLVNRLPLYLTWLLSFAGLYFLTIRSTLGNETLTDSWGTRYPNSLVDVLWLLDAFGRFFYNPLGFLGITDGIAILSFVVGCVVYYRRNRVMLLVLMAPMLVTIAASYLEQYPFRERLVLFLTPFAILIIATGVACPLEQRRDRWRDRSKSALILGIFLFSALVLPPAIRASHLLVRPTQVEEIRPVIAYVKSHQTPGDRLYVYRSGINQFLYYAPRFGYSPEDYVLGKNSMATGGRRNRQLSAAGVRQFKRELRQFRGDPRVWFLFCRASAEEEQAFLSVMEPIGQPLDTFRQTDAVVNLYSLKLQGNGGSTPPDPL